MRNKSWLIFGIALIISILGVGTYLYVNHAENKIDKELIFKIPETSWLNLLPPEDLKALEDMPSIMHDSEEMPGGFDSADGLRQAQGLPDVMYSTKTVASLDGKLLRLGGYPVPLELNAKGEVVEFFLVPYPGACIHVPPPPPNQLIWVKSDKPFVVENIYYPIWVVGKLNIEQVSNKLGDAAYTMNALAVIDIEEDDEDPENF